MIKTWLLKAVLAVLFPIGIYVWFTSRKTDQRNAELEQSLKEQHQAQVKREAVQTVVQQSQATHIESLEKEAKVRANTTSRQQVVDRMQTMKLRADKRASKRSGGKA